MLTVLAAIGLSLGCDQKEPTTQKPPPPAPSRPSAPTNTQATSSQPPAAQPKAPQTAQDPKPTAAPKKPDAPPEVPSATPSTTAPKPSGSPAGTFQHEGIKLQIPSIWTAEPAPQGPLAAVASYKLPKVEGDPEDGSFRISHYPNMKGKDDPNIDRWIGQVRKPDGQPLTRSDARIERFEIGPVRVILVDVSGTVSVGMMGGEAKPDFRTINAILDHPYGPHFIRASGPAKTMKQWESAIESLVRSAVVTD